MFSYEAEYIAATQATKELLFPQRLVKEIQLPPVGTLLMIILHFDNLGVIQLANNPQFYSRTKNIDIPQHFVQEVLASKLMDIVWISTLKMTAEELTKQLPQLKFKFFIQLISLENTTFLVLPPQVKN